jgi:hypothetical protein
VAVYTVCVDVGHCDGPVYMPMCVQNEVKGRAHVHEFVVNWMP